MKSGIGLHLFKALSGQQMGLHSCLPMSSSCCSRLSWLENTKKVSSCQKGNWGLCGLQVLGHHWRHAVAISFNAHILEYSKRTMTKPEEEGASECPWLRADEAVHEASWIVSSLQEGTSLLCRRANCSTLGGPIFLTCNTGRMYFRQLDSQGTQRSTLHHCLWLSNIWTPLLLEQILC